MRTERRVAVGLGLAVALAAALLITPDRVVPWLRRAIRSPWFPALLVGLYLLRPVVAWPIALLSAVVGFRYGLAMGLPIALAGAVFTSLPAYLAARWLAPGGGLIGRLSAGSQRYFAATGDLRGLVAARLAPTPAEAISGAAGAAGVSAPAFVLGTAVGEFPWTVAAVLAGSSLSRLDAGAVGPDPRLVLAAATLGALLLAGPTYRFVARRTADH